MRISLRWLAELVSGGSLGDLPADELARRLTMQGLEVGEVRAAFPAFEGVVLAAVAEVGPHPGADRLSVCRVRTGDGERRVVCGAPNVEAGATYGYATVGARLPDGREIGRAEIRGVESEGMLCSAPELGLDALGSAEGIWPVPGVGEADLGRDLREVLGLDDRVLDVEVTSNRGDLLSHLGVAREAAWLVAGEAAAPRAKLDEAGEAAAGRTGVTVEDPEGCPRYLGRLIEGVTVGPSPGWLQTRLLALGMRPVNNVVDATNFVMLERGQPLHPFDFERLAGGRIVVRRAAEGEPFVTLDGKRRRLDPETTMICDAERPVAVGGVMGGLESEVSGSTRTVFLESAWFEPARIARTARRLGLATEASVRFARGVDPAGVADALDRAAGLIVELAGGTVAPGTVGDEPGPLPRPPRVELRLARLAALNGRQIGGDEAGRALSSLGFDVEAGEGTLAAVVPGWRFDVAREVDLIEEVARLTGYDGIPETPLPAPPVAPARRPEDVGRARVAEAARAAGFAEAHTPSFVAADVLGAVPSVDNLVEIRNPISKADGFLRPFVFATLGRAVAHNVRRGARRAKLFEIGHAFAPEGAEGVDERRRVALAASGARDPVDWSRVDVPEYDFFDLKGDVEDVVHRATGGAPSFVAGEREYLHPGRQAEVLDAGGRAIGFCGEVHPRLVERWDVGARLFVAELDLDALCEPRPPTTFEPFPREPAIERDLALVVPDGTSAGEVVAAVEAADLDHLVEVTVFDRYRGAQVPDGRYSLGLRLTFRAGRTLTDEEVDDGLDRLVGGLDRERGWTLR